MDRMATRENVLQGDFSAASCFRPSASCARQVCWLPMDMITLRPRTNEEPKAELPASPDRMTLRQLAASIDRRGLLDPITVRAAASGQFEIVSGNRRYLACRMNGATHIDAVVLADMPAQRISAALLSRLQSGHLHYLQEAQSLKQLLDEGVTREELARGLGRTAADVAATARLAELDDELQRFLMDHDLSESHARALSKLPDRLTRLAIARQAAAQRLCVRDVELLVASAVKRLPVPPPRAGRTISLMRDHRLYLNAIRAIIAQMQEVGIAAEVTQMKFGSHVELMVSIPTRARRVERCAKGEQTEE